MAKMFYTIEEAADRLNVKAANVKKMADEGTLQPFRDGSRVMFKREHVEQLANEGSAVGASGAGGTAVGGSGGPIDLADTDFGDTGLSETGIDLGATGSETGLSETGIDLAATGSDTGLDFDDPQSGTSSGTDVGMSDTGIELVDTGEADAIDLAEDSAAPAARAPREDPREATGVSVFEADELDDDADPMAQTQVTQPVEEEEDLALESVGSGSGLLDLTRESDDTSLGAELLDEIYPSEGGETGMESAVGSSGVFDTAVAADTGLGVGGGIENLDAGGSGVISSPAAGAGVAHYDVEASDPAGSGFGAGMLLGATVALILGLIVVAAEIAGARSAIQTMMIDPGQGGHNSVLLWAGGLLLLSIIFGVVGLFIGRAAAR